MTTANEARLLHHMLDLLVDKQDIGTRNIEKLRAELPEIPKQKTLEELRKEVYAAWLGASGNTWDYDGHELETWLDELYTQLKGVALSTQPALPAGMRIADHNEYGRVVVSTKKDVVGCYAAFRLGNWNFSGVADHYVSPDALTFIHDEPFAPAHPEFLETEADYENAPDGTIVAADKVSTAWIKTSEAWHSTDGDRSVECPTVPVGTRRILRWGWGNE